MDLVGTAFKLFHLRDDLARGGELLGPEIEDFKKILPELIAIASRVARELGVEIHAKDVTVASFDVFWVQRALNKLGQTPPLKVDGGFGKITQAAVKAYQLRKAIVPDDGIPGEMTCAHLKIDMG